MNFLGSFPLLAIPVIGYNFFAMMSRSDGRPAHPLLLNGQLTRIPMPSGQGVYWSISWGDLFLMGSMVLLFMEILKSVSGGRSVIINHALSMALFVFCLVEFLILSPFATSTFFLLVLMTLLDVLAGFIVTIGTARRDISFSHD